MTSPDIGDDAAAEPFAIRSPKQRRSREAWQRVLDAGVALVEEGGYDAFTIAAVCERAQVTPRALYDRADSKDALFLAVYEHGIGRLRADQEFLSDDRHWHGLSDAELVDRVVREVARTFNKHSSFLRAVVLIGGAHAEVRRRGALHSQQFGEAFCHRLLAIGPSIDHADPETAVRAAFNALYSVLVLRVTYGPGFAVPDVDEETFLETLVLMLQRYLLPGR